MAGVNKVIVLGRIGKDPELSYAASGMAICKFSLATSEKNKQGEEKTEWHRCVAFQKAGELIAQYVQKGDELYVEGKISYGKYNKDGVDVYTTDIIVNQMNFISGKKGGGQGQPQNQQPPQNNYNQQPQGGGYNSQPHGQGYNQGGYQSGPQGGYNQGRNEGGHPKASGGFNPPPDDD